MPLPDGHAAERQRPRRRRPTASRSRRLGKRIYRDELKLTRGGATRRRRYWIYGDDPGFHDEPGTDLAAVAAGPHRGHAAALRPDRRRRAWTRSSAHDLARLLAARRRRGGVSADATTSEAPRRGAARAARATTRAATTSSTTRRSATTSTTRCSTSCRRSRRSTPSCVTPDSPTQRVGGEPVSRAARRSATSCRCSRWPTRARRRSCAPGSQRMRTPPRARGDRGPGRSRSSAEPKIDGLAISLLLRGRRASSAARRAATARSARTSRTTCARSPTIPLRIERRAAACSRSAARSTCRCRTSPR